MTFLSVLFQYFIRLPHFLLLEAVDFFYYIKNRGWQHFEGWGLHLYVGAFGAGKTCSMVQRAYSICRQYKSVSVVTNINLYNFPSWTKIYPLRTTADILNAPPNTLVVIDEIGTIFNSRDFVGKAKEGVPKILFQHLCQCRKRHMQILATTQRWNFLDKQLRDITATVRVTRSHFSHPFTRICTVYTYDAPEYDLAFSNPMYPLRALGASVYVQSDTLRSRYDTVQLVDNMLKAEYLSDAEILANRGELDTELEGLADGKAARKVRRNAHKLT